MTMIIQISGIPTWNGQFDVDANYTKLENLDWFGWIIHMLQGEEIVIRCVKRDDRMTKKLIIQVVVSDEEMRTIRRAAAVEGGRIGASISLSTYCRDAIMRRVRTETDSDSKERITWLH